MHLADVGAPMILIEWPLMLCALIPIIFIEAEVARRRLKLPYGKAFNAAAKANALSTGAGVPLAWAVMLVIELATMYPIAAAADKWHWSFDSPVLYLSFVLAMAWGAPPTTSWWPITLGAMLLLIPTFLVSVWLERRSYRKSWTEVDRSAVDRTVWSANVWSYTLLFAVISSVLAWQVYAGPEKGPAMKRAQAQPIDLGYLREVVLPSANPVLRPKLAAAAADLESYCASFDTFMRDVKNGSVPVVKRIDRGRWQAFVQKPDSWISATFTDKADGIADGEEFHTRGPMIYRFEFNKAGYVIYAATREESFEFDDHGRLTHWHKDKADYWGKPGQ